MDFIPLIIGVILVIFNQKITEIVINYRKKQLGKYVGKEVRFGKKVVDFSRIVTIVVGILFISLSLLLLLDIVKTRT